MVRSRQSSNKRSASSAVCNLVRGGGGDLALVEVNLGVPLQMRGDGFFRFAEAVVVGGAFHVGDELGFLGGRAFQVPNNRRQPRSKAARKEACMFMAVIWCAKVATPPSEPSGEESCVGGRQASTHEHDDQGAKCRLHKQRPA